MENTSTERLQFADYARPVAQRKWLILVAIIVATVGVYVYYDHQPKVFSAGTLVFTKDPGDPATGTASGLSTDRAVQNQAALLYSRSVAQTVQRQIEYPGTPEQLLGTVSIKAQAGQDFVAITARAGSPTLAADIVNGYARTFVALSNSQQRQRLDKALALRRKQLTDLAPGKVNTTTRQQLSDEIRRLQLAVDVPSSATQQVDRASPPPKAESPKPKRNAIFAFVLALVLAVTIAFGLERFDRRVKRPEDVERIYGLPLLAVLSHAPKPAPMLDGLASLSSSFRESFQSLRTNIDLANLDRPAKTILVTSAVPGEGKSTVVRNLALAFRETGKRVAVVEGDLRRPALLRLFGLPPALGLTEVLTGDATLADVVHVVPVKVPGLATLARLHTAPAETEALSDGTATAEGTIALLPSGARPANPTAVLESERLLEVLGEFVADYDIVIIDSAPLLAVTDTVPLLRYADSVLLVNRLGYTTRDTAKRLVEFVSRVPGARPLGVVANDLSAIEATGYGYGSYGYGYGYGDRDRDSSPAPSGT